MRISPYLQALLLLISVHLYAQTPTTIVKGGGTEYIVTGTETLTATQSITLKPNTWIKSGSTFTARVIADSYLSIIRSNENYVYSRSYQKAMSSASGITENKDVIENITYFDGLGRPMQSVGIKASPDKKDIVTHIGYDDYGRQSKEWLPYKASGTLGTYRGTGAEAATDTYYIANYPGDITSGAANPYSEKELEASPLNRVLKQSAPGSAWALGSGHEIEFDYQTNTGTEVKRYEVSITESTVDNITVYTPSLILNGSYGAGELYKTVTKDENWVSGTNHTTEEFKDKQGRVVLKRSYNNGAHDTYYVYDDYGNLSYVLPPKSEAHTAKPDATELSELCYQYQYDDRNRLVEKKIPGKGTASVWEEIVYNKLDQPILTRDPNLRNQNKWLFIKYDAFGRVVYTGILNSSYDRTTLQGSANTTTDQYESRQGTKLNMGGGEVFYSNNAYPKTGIVELHTVSYYDSYLNTADMAGMSVPGTVKTQATSTGIALKGLATVSKVRVLTTNHFITTITGYDKKGRVIYNESDNPYLNTGDKIESKLDFVGKVEETTTTHTKGANPPVVITDKFYYDHMGRLTKQTQTLGSKIEVIAQNSYDDLGQLQQKKVGNTTSKPLQTVDYTYNVRGWLKQINNPNSLGSDLFGFKINYNTTEMGVSGVTPLFNGNISETVWRTANPETNGTRIRGYAYTYDALNRIESGQFRRGNSAGSGFNEETNSYNVTGITYDKNGNIKTLNRRGVVNTSNGIGNMDNLVYSYDRGNKLTKVLDNGNNAYGFKDGANTTTEYTYDDNGNMIMDLNKGIQSGGITYNHLNLPTSVTITGGNITYIYDAVGTKLKKVAGATTTEYAGNYIYENGSLKFFSHAEGYVDTEAGNEYVYQYKDHLGNVRLSYKNVGTSSSPNLQIQEENNYYPFGLKHKGYNNSPVSTNIALRYKYQSQELNNSFYYDMYEFELRHYDPAIGRFITNDPYEQFMSPYLAMGNNPVVSFDPDGGYCYDSDGKRIACPGEDIYDDYRDNKDNHINILDDVVVTGKSKETEANERYWREINKSAEILDKLATLETGKTSKGRAEEARTTELAPLSIVQIKPQVSYFELPWYIGGKGGYKALNRLLRVKSVSLPALKSLTIDMTHVLSGHVKGGSRVSSMKTLFDSNLSPKQIENMIKAAYKNAKKLKTQGNRIKVVGQSDNGTVIEMWVNKTTKVIETAYPIK